MLTAILSGAGFARVLSFCALLAYSSVVSTVTLQAEQKPSLSTIPRVDVHAHICPFKLFAAHLGVGKVLKEGHGVNEDSDQPF